MKTFRNVALCLAVLVLASMTVLAATKDGYTTAKSGRQTIATKAHPVVPSDWADSGTSFIFNNIGSAYPLGRYWCCEGWTISGPDSVIGAQYADAMPFTPAADATVTKIVVAVGYVTGTNGVSVSLNADSNGLPGATLAGFNLSNLPIFGSCCTYEVQGTSVPVTKGTQYWVVVGTGPLTTDTWDAWNDNDTNETETQPFAFYSNGVWENTEGILGAFAVVGQ